MCTCMVLCNESHRVGLFQAGETDAAVLSLLQGCWRESERGRLPDPSDPRWSSARRFRAQPNARASPLLLFAT
ncbi:MAG: hypothetical protein B7733_02485 [Myxococcales bacterium FL481]|nr:MAG: hypothetical protein B7733_02485 [Myxococcales bacterium FL481]